MRFRGVGAGLILLVLLGVVGFSGMDFQASCRDCWFFRHHRHGSYERNPSTTLKTLPSAQAELRANDRDGDQGNQFWRADIAGLYALAPGGGPAIRLIELSTAAADDRPVLSIAPDARRAPRADTGIAPPVTPTRRRSTRNTVSPPKAIPPITPSRAAGPSSSTRTTRSSEPTGATATASTSLRPTTS